MTEIVKLQAEIDKAARDLERSYEGTLRRLRKLKDRLSTLEQTVSRNRGSEVVDRVKALDSASESLSRLSDKLIIKSKRAWQIYARLERECSANGLKLTRLDEFQALCRKTEAVATDLLCYTLGSLKRTSNQFE